MDLAAYEGHPSPDHEIAGTWPEEQIEMLSEAFLTIGSAQPAMVQAPISSRIHNQRDREKGRAWKDRDEKSHGAVFAFESLDAGQSFQGFIQVRGESEEECDQIESRIKELIGDSILVGRSRRAGYGGMPQIDWREDQAREIEGVGAEGLRPITGDIVPGAEFRVLLTSACIARHPCTGQIDPAALEKMIIEALKGHARLTRKRWAFETIGGFNRKWRLETPQALAAAPGSVFVLKANQTIPVDDLRRIEHDGLGERKEEGYGRMLFLDAPIPRIDLRRPTEPKPESFDGQAPQLVLDIQQRILNAQIQRHIDETAARLIDPGTKLPKNSPIGRLRTALRHDSETAIRTLDEWLGDDKAKQLKLPAMKQLDGCRVKTNGNRQRFSDWLREAVQTENVLKWLPINKLSQNYYVVSVKSAEEFLRKRHKEFSVRLIDAVLAAMALKNKTKEGGDEV
jgi:CRISPR-associated protein Csx10